MFRYRTTLQSNYRRFPFPSRPTPGWPVTEHICHQSTGVSTTIPIIPLTTVFPRVWSYHRRITVNKVEFPRVPLFQDHRRTTAFTVDSCHYRRFSIYLPIITEVSRSRIRLPSSCRRIPLPSGPLPRCIVTKQVQV